MRMVINSVAYKNGKRIGDITLDEISDVLKDDDTFVWVGLNEPNDTLLHKIQEEFGLHELVIEDAQAAHQRPKIEEYDDTLFIVLHTAQMWNDALHFGETHLFVGERFLVSLRHGPSISYAAVREHCEHRPQQLAWGPSFAVYALMDFIVDNYQPILSYFEDRLQNLESEIFRGRFTREDMEQLYDFKRNLLNLRNAAAPVTEICNNLTRFHEATVPPHIHVYFRDVSDHVMRSIEAMDNMREMLTAAMHANLTLVTVQQNEVVKKLAGWSAIVALPLVIFNLYGMNFKDIPELQLTYGYPVLLGVTALACLILYVRFKRAGWL